MSMEEPLSAELFRLVATMARLRDPDRGCDWDRAQDHASLARYSVEEAYEVVDAIERADWTGLRDELGDLLLQVVFHSQIAAEAGHFALADVFASIADKMERRHPHVFGEGSNPGWEVLKARERQSGADGSVLAGIARSLPALSRAASLGERAALVGFDWDDAAGVAMKVVEELDEIASAVTDAEREEEFGDLLLTLVSWGRRMGVDGETALRRANAKFERRFRAMEAAEPALASLAPVQKEAAWRRAKALLTERSGTDRQPEVERAE